MKIIQNLRHRQPNRNKKEAAFSTTTTSQGKEQLTEKDVVKRFSVPTFENAHLKIRKTVG